MGRSRFWRWVVVPGAALGAGMLLSACEVPEPVTFVVDTTFLYEDTAPGDGICEIAVGGCGVRAALQEAEHAKGAVTIELHGGGTYRLTPYTDVDGSADLDVDPGGGRVDLVAIDGPARFQADGVDHVFEVHAGFLGLEGIRVDRSESANIEVHPRAAVRLERSEVSGGDAAGVRVAEGGAAAIVNSTVVFNDVGIVADGVVAASFATITNNAAGGIAGSGTPILEGTILAENGSGADCATPADSRGYNLDGDGTCGLAAAGDQPATAPELEPFQLGRTVRLPRAGSPVLDVIPADVAPCAGAGTDLVGAPRPAGTGCDIGAVEMAAPVALTVDDPADVRDAAPGDGACASPSGGCTLRAAVDELNAITGVSVEPHTIDLAVDVTLALPGSDDDANASGDLDLRAARVALVGAGHTIDAAGLDRVLHHDDHDDEYGFPSSVLLVEQVTITGGEALRGGAIYSLGIRLDVSDSTFVGNRATYTGGAINAASSSLTVDGSTFEGNVGIFGADIAVLDRSATIRNSTFAAPGTAGHSAIYTGVAAEFGDGAPARVIASTFGPGTSLEVASEYRCSMAICGTWTYGGAITISGSVLDACEGLTSAGYNRSIGTACGLDAPTDAEGVDLLLGPLADNGGPTRTFLPLVGSTLRDAIPPGTPDACDASLPNDQRGVARPQGTACDIGAVESPSPS